MGHDPAEQADVLRDSWERGNGVILRQLTGAGWYHRHQVPVYIYGAPLVDFLLRRFGPEKFLELYTSCRVSTFDADCRRVLGLDVDGLDASLRLEGTPTRQLPGDRAARTLGTREAVSSVFVGLTRTIGRTDGPDGFSLTYTVPVCPRRSGFPA
ncbi:MAG: hypothetical protein ACYC61_19300 [Isosphaeraceae bacterium]